MKILWITNIVFPEAYKLLTGEDTVNNFGGWMLGAAEALLQQQDVELTVATPSKNVKELRRLEGKRISYYLLPLGKGNLKKNDAYRPYWREIHDTLYPDVVHIHGTEFSHGLAYVEECGSDNVVVSIQGLVSVIANYYCAGISLSDIYQNLTLRDIIKGNIIKDKKRFEMRGRKEVELLKKVRHVIGRTIWDKSHVRAINLGVEYYFCNETLRSEFYSSQWEYTKCQPHTIFLSSMAYPIKGFHQVLKAMPLILRQYPDTQIRVAGGDGFYPSTFFQRLRSSGYNKYLRSLIDKYNMKDHITFLGPLNAEQMKREYLNANVFICPSSIENSPNSLGEAQLLGTPIVAAYVGGIPDMMKGNEGSLYRFEEIEMLASRVCDEFSNLTHSKSELMRIEASNRHDREGNAKQLLSIYHQVSII